MSEFPRSGTDHGSEQVPADVETGLLSREELRGEYAQAAALRSVNERIGAQRGAWRQVMFGARLVPKFVANAFSRPERIGYGDLAELGIDPAAVRPLVDLSAFDLADVRNGTFDASPLVRAGAKDVVIMEDRDPMFFLNHGAFDETSRVPLNRHGKKYDAWTHGDFRALIAGLHAAGLKADIGFWGNTGNKNGNPFIRDNWDALRPVVPLSDDVNPLSFVQGERGERVPFADVVVSQYAKIRRDFGVDGLFLGDGLMGFRSFLDHDGPYDASSTCRAWTDFYARIRSGIRAENPDATLSAYDCMGNGAALAERNGLDLSAIAPHVDRYVFQSYGNDAWGKEYMSLPGYDLARDAAELATLPGALRAKTAYTMGLGDAVEGWNGKKANIAEKHAALKNLAPGGSLGVWSNGMVRHALKQGGF